MAENPDTCPHDDIAVQAHTNRVTLASGEPAALMLSIEATCQRCGSRFWFPGLNTGVSYIEPVTDQTGFTLTTPLVRQNRRNNPDPSLVSFGTRGGDLVKGYIR